MITAILLYDNKILDLKLNKSTIADDLYVTFTEELTAQSRRYQLMIHPKKDVLLQGLEVKIVQPIDPSVDMAFCNGFQSASESRLYPFGEMPDHMRRFARKNWLLKSDNEKTFIKRDTRHLHSWTYGFLQQMGAQEVNFIGSLDESTALTLVEYNAQDDSVTLKKDFSAITLTHSFPALDFVMLAGTREDVFQRYFSLQNIEKKDTAPYVGWASAGEKNDLTEKWNAHNTLITKGFSPNTALLTDGWQAHIGDWLAPKNDPHYFTTQARNNGQTANPVTTFLWLAPFAVASNSRIFKEKNDWILRGGDGKIMTISSEKKWGGAIYALDFYKKEVQEYLAGVFLTVFQKWGFDGVVVDCLYAAAVARKNKTSAQALHDALQFLQQLAGQKIMMAGEVPLGLAFGKVPFCAVGTEGGTAWDNGWQRWLKNRERPSTLSALRSALNRADLNGYGFHNWLPLHNGLFSKKKLTAVQRETILTVTSLLIKPLIFNDLSVFSNEEIDLIFSLNNSRLTSVKTLAFDVYAIHFEAEGKKKTCFVNLNAHPHNVDAINIAPFTCVIES